MVIDQSHKKLYQAYEKAIDSFNKIADFSKSLMTREARKAQVTADYTKARAKIGRQLNDFVGHLQQKYPLVASLGKYWGERSTDNTRLVFLLDQNFEKMKAKDVVDSAREILKIIRHGMHYDRLKKEIFVDDHDRMAAMDRVVDEFEKRFAKKA